MKKLLIVCVLIVVCAALCACEPAEYVLTESNFFRIMTNMTFNPEGYLGKDITFDSFTYRLTDTDGNEYMCAVRKCSSGYGCKCGKDTIIGFILDYDGDIPEPKNQSEDTVEKTWIHTKGQLVNAEKVYINIFAYNEAGEIDHSAAPETVFFYTFKVQEMELVQEYANLAYYVTK